MSQSKTTCQLLGWVAGPVNVGGNKGLETYEAVAGKDGLMLFRMTETVPGAAASVAKNMEAAGNGDYKPSGIKEVIKEVLPKDEKVLRALELYDLVEKALEDKKIDVAEGIGILNQASKIKDGKAVLSEGIVATITAGAQLLEGVLKSKKPAK